MRLRDDGTAEISHDWLSGTGEATLDSAGRLLGYSGARTTYLVDVRRLDSVPDVQAIGARFADLEAKGGGAKALSVRDTLRATIGAASQTGQWGTGYDRARDLGRARMTTDTLAQLVEQFTISITGKDARRGTLAMEWGDFRWTAPIELR